MAPHSSTLAWKIPWTEEPVGCSAWGRKESETTERLHFQFSLSCIGEGNGNTLPCSCLENPRDGEAWCAAIYGVAQSRTWLKRLSSSTSSFHLCLMNNYAYLILNIYTDGEGNGNPLHYSCLENSMDREAWWATVHVVAKSWTWQKWLSIFTEVLPRWLSGKEFACQCRRCRYDPWPGRTLGKRKETHSTILPWKIPWTEDNGGLQSMGS